MNESASINANSGPAATVFPPRAVTQAPAPARPVLGIVMLDTRFPRPPGDVGHAATWGVPVNFNVVRGIWPDKVVRSAKGLRAGRVTPAFISVVRHLEKSGVAAITTSCGFLVLLQKELQAVCKVPVLTSSLLLLRHLVVNQHVAAAEMLHPLGTVAVLSQDGNRQEKEEQQKGERGAPQGANSGRSRE